MDCCSAMPESECALLGTASNVGMRAGGSRRGGSWGTDTGTDTAAELGTVGRTTWFTAGCAGTEMPVDG